MKLKGFPFIIGGMKNFWLTKDQIEALRAAHRAERNSNAAYKLNAVILLGSGWNLKAVKEALLLDDETLRSYVKKYKSGGIEALIKTNHQGSNASLSVEQQKSLTEELEANIYLTACAVAEYVKETFGVVYSVSGIRDLLHRLDFGYKKPKLIPGNPDREAQEYFVEYYEEFMNDKPSNEGVFFIGLFVDLCEAYGAISSPPQ